MENIDIEAAIELVMTDYGVGREEAGSLVAQAIQKRAEQKKNTPEVKFSSLRTDKERAEYMRALRERVSANVWISPEMKAEMEYEQKVANSQELFKQRMKERASAGGPMRSIHAATDFFKKP